MPGEPAGKKLALAWSLMGAQALTALTVIWGWEDCLLLQISWGGQTRVGEQYVQVPGQPFGPSAWA